MLKCLTYFGVLFLLKGSRSREETQKLEYRHLQHQHQKQQQQQNEHLLMEQLHLGQHAKHYPVSSNFTPLHGPPHQHAQMQVAFPPVYDQFHHHRFNFAPPSVRPTPSIIEGQQQNQFQTPEYLNHPPHNLGHIIPGSIQQAPAFPVVYQENPAYFFYQQ